MSEVVKCIDISHWQSFPDFEEVARQGVLAVIHKATEGTSYVDPNRGKNLKNARDAGLAIATYFWLKPGDARPQAQFYLDTVQPVDGERVVIDYEEDGCTLEGLRKAVQTLLDYGHNLQIAVYSGHLLKGQLGDDCDEFLQENTSLWLAQYTTGTPSWPSGTYPQWSLWQYTDQGELDGIEGSTVDFNRFNGSDEALLKWMGPADGGVRPEPEPEPEPKPLKVKIEITSPPGVEIEITTLEG